MDEEMKVAIGDSKREVSTSGYVAAFAPRVLTGRSRSDSVQE